MARFALLLFMCLLAALAALLPAGPVGAAKIPDVRNTKHNLSASGPGTVKATTESQICVFCHTPHAAESIPAAPLWNRKLSGATYTPYTSSSIEATAAELASGPGGSSKLCLSCHDGTMALGSVNVLNGAANPTIAMSGTGPGGTMATGAGATTGFTRNLGVNLTNDHPISFTYDAALAGRDGELRGPDGTLVGTRSPGVKPKLPLEGGQIQCSSCHDPHVRETDPLKGSAKFLRLNRFQEASPTGGAFSQTGDIICIACHDKAGQAWALSAHANPQVADELYTGAAATQREFPANLPVWRAACLNCHDSHTVQGSRRLLREGTDSTATPKAGGNSAIEETCYQCHASLAQSALTSVANVPNIKDDFSLTRRMPIKTSDQQSGGEVHDIGTGTGTQRGKDFLESPTLLGKSAPTNRHVECTDCHNPHRVTKNRLFNASAAVPDVAGTHSHAAGHTNIASGVLRGGTGVEPVYGGAAFGTPPSSYDLKRGDGGTGASSAAGSAWVTREYQVCLKCHSNYAYDTPPNLGDSGGGTPSGTNGMTQFTNQAMEFQAPAGHKGLPASTTDSGAYAGAIRSGCATPTTPCGGSCVCYNVNFQTRNNRSWHPVMDSTGRTHALRGTGTNAWRAPWNATADVGSQTMYCSDCHGSNTRADSVDPNCTTGTTGCGENGAPWGPHGSTNNFILKGTWDSTTANTSANALCLKCHSPTSSSGFSGGGRGNLHEYHRDKIGSIRCTWCHVAVPHGWKNRSFLVNLNDVGPEAGLPAGTQVRNKTTAAYNNGPYYLNAKLKIRTFGTSGSWSDTNCGSVGAPGNGQSGRDWMRDSNENCASGP
ncbi:MAG TPA: cytochrome c3 family protein [Ramlibacter sp.]|nr:cytochrome c3 family protein [Ramlibacter sp.]